MAKTVREAEKNVWLISFWGYRPWSGKKKFPAVPRKKFSGEKNLWLQTDRRPTDRRPIYTYIYIVDTFYIFVHKSLYVFMYTYTVGFSQKKFPREKKIAALLQNFFVRFPDGFSQKINLRLVFLRVNFFWVSRFFFFYKKI